MIGLVALRFQGTIVEAGLKITLNRGGGPIPMKTTVFAMTLVLIPMLTRGVVGTESVIIAPGAKLEKVAGGFKFTEGPAADARGNVYFTDQPNDRILKWSTGGKLSTFMQPCGRSNGLCFDRQNNLWACADEDHELWCIGPDRKVKVVVKGYRASC